MTESKPHEQLFADCVYPMQQLIERVSSIVCLAALALLADVVMTPVAAATILARQLVAVAPKADR
jgi:hypothetical protein